MGVKAKCGKCGDIIESTYRHDFKRCSCGSIFVDGGNDYFRCGGDFNLLLVKRDGKWESIAEQIKKEQAAKRDQNVI